MLTRQDGITEGNARKLAGMALASEGRTFRMKAAQLAMIDAALGREDATCSADDIPADLSAEYVDGGKWVGGAVRGVANTGIIERVGFDPSARPSRHGSHLSRWRLIDRNAAEAYRDELAWWLEANAPPPPIPEDDAPLFALMADKKSPVAATTGRKSETIRPATRSALILPRNRNGGAA